MKRSKQIKWTIYYPHLDFMRSILYSLLVIIITIGFAMLSVQAQNDCGNAANNLTMVKTATDQLFNQKSAAAVDQYWATNYIDHDPNSPNGSQQLKDRFATNESTVTRFVTGLGVAEKDLVMLHSKYERSGEPSLISMDIYRVASGKIIEHWDVLQEEDETESGNAMFPISSSAGNFTSSDNNKQLVMDALIALYTNANSNSINQYWATNYQEHGPLVGNGQAGLRDYFITNRPPSFTYEFGYAMQQGDFVFVHGRYTGMRLDEVTTEIGTDIFKVQNGKIVARWSLLQEEVPANETESGNSMWPVSSSCSGTSGTSGNRILADGYFNDWASIPVTYMDASNDGGSNGVNFGELKVANDPEYLFFTFTTGVELNLSLGNRIVNNDWGPAQGITIYLDTDNNANTGFRINGIGAEFEYNFGAKRGNFYNGSQTPTPITWDQLGTAISLVSVPAISSNQFEIAINRNNTVSGTRVFPNNSNNIKIVLRDNTPNGDMMPAAGQTINYSFTSGSLASLPSYSFSKLQNTDVRVMCYNTEFNSIIDSLDYTDEYQRIFAATQPEIIAFQEIWHKFDDNHPTSQDLANRMNTLYPIAGGWQYHQRYGADIVLLSKYPIRQHAYIQGNDPGTEGSGAGAFLIDLPNNSKDLLVINAHPPHGMQHVPRQKEIDLIMQWLRRAKAGQGPWALPANTPFTIMGDMNLVGNDEDVRTFVTGDIVDPQYGPDFKPDWDGSDLVHVNNHMAEAPFAFTWYDIPYDPPFPPAKLDGVFYSDSQMSLPNQFGLFTPTLSSSTLNATGLRANDVPLVSDHIPLIMDFRIRN